MKKTKFIVSTLLILVFAISMTTITSFAADVTVPVTVSQATANPGGEASVTVDIPADINLATAKIITTYDNSKLELVSAVASASTASASPVLNPKYAENKVAFVLASVNAINKGGPMFELKFKVKDGAAIGQTPITIEIEELYNGDLNEIKTTITNGYVDIQTKQEPSSVEPSSVEPSSETPSSVEPSSEVPSSVAPSTEPTTSEPSTEQVSTSTPSTSVPNTNTGAVGVAGVASALALSVVALAVFSKKNKTK